MSLSLLDAEVRLPGRGRAGGGQSPSRETPSAGLFSSNNLRYADDTTLVAESEEKLKGLLMKVKVESEKVAESLSTEPPGKPIIKGAAAAAAKSLQSCPTLRDPIDGSPPGSPVPGILQARTLEWVAISFSSACK